MPRTPVTAPSASAIGPYSHAVDADGTFYLSGQTPIDPATGKLREGDIAAQTQQCFDNLFSVLAAANLSPGDVQKVNVFLTNMDDFAAMNEVYARQFEKPYPARTTIEVKGLPLGARIEIEMVAKRRA